MVSDTWREDLSKLPDDQLREVLALALEHETKLRTLRFMGKSPKVRREYRMRREAVQAELASRGLT